MHRGDVERREPPFPGGAVRLGHKRQRVRVHFQGDAAASYREGRWRLLSAPGHSTIYFPEVPPTEVLEPPSVR